MTVKRRGRRGDYACDQQPLGSGGYADVFPALHKPTDTRVALKRLKATVDDQAVPRMKREIRVMEELVDEQHVMPVMDADPDGTWYVMPLAEGDAFALRPLLQDAGLVGLLSSAVHALSAAHAANYVHRDVTPRNLLRLHGGLWVVADWGLARGRPGYTTTVLTSTDVVVGTDGFIAPEILRGEGGPDAPADVYSLGRVAAWAVTGRVPLAGQELLPDGPFRRLVRDATRDDPRSRLSLDEFAERLSTVRFEPPPLPSDDAARLAEAGRDGDPTAWSRLLELGQDNLDDAELFLDFVSRIPRAVINGFVVDNPEAAERMASAMLLHLRDNFGSRHFDRYNKPLAFIWHVAAAAEKAGNMGLLEDASLALMEGEAYSCRFDQRRATRQWFERLRGPAAATVARALEDSPNAVEWYVQEGWAPSRNADAAIRAVLTT